MGFNVFSEVKREEEKEMFVRSSKKIQILKFVVNHIFVSCLAKWNLTWTLLIIKEFWKSLSLTNLPKSDQKTKQEIPIFWRASWSSCECFLTSLHMNSLIFLIYLFKIDIVLLLIVFNSALYTIFSLKINMIV